MNSSITIAIADDQHLFRKGIRNLCDSFENIKVILEASNGAALMIDLENTSIKPQVLLIDLNMPELDGIETTKLIKKIYPDIKIIVLTGYNEERFILHLLECGANAYLLKECEPEELERCIRSVANDGYYFPEHILKVLNSHGAKTKHRISSNNPFVDLTEREKEILSLICEELTAAEIADKLFLSVRTVEGHRNNLLLKTGCKNTAGLVIFAIKNHIFLPKF